ncbi:MAG: hypothetical protein ACI8UO_005104, partial [Verrucomicrobiales bacterium]
MANPALLRKISIALESSILLKGFLNRLLTGLNDHRM